MPSYVAFLRAVNLGRTRKLAMADARAWLTEAGFAGVETHIQTGNLRFETSLRSRRKVEQVVEQVLGDACGFDVPTIAFSPRELRRVYDDARELVAPEHGELRRYVTFLKEAPDAEVAAAVDAWDVEGEGARVVGRAVHWWIASLSRAARMSNARIEKLLGPSTTRDLKVVTTLADRWGA